MAAWKFTIEKDAEDAGIKVIARRGSEQRFFDLGYREVDYRGAVEAVSWQGWFAIGFGGLVMLVSEDVGTVVRTDLGCFFESFVADDAYLLVLSGQGITRFDAQGRIVWRNDELGLDGVLVFDIEGDVIDGQGQWDPPDGWREFLVSLETGDTLEEVPDEQDQDA